MRSCKYIFWVSLLGNNRDKGLQTLTISAQETFMCEVEVIKAEMTSCELVVEGQFVSQATMEEWGFSE